MKRKIPQFLFYLLAPAIAIVFISIGFLSLLGFTLFEVIKGKVK